MFLFGLDHGIFLIYSDSFIVEKVEESTHMTIFTDMTHFDKLGTETFQKNFEALNDIFWG